MLSANRAEANFRTMGRRNATHPIEQVGEQVRAIVPWTSTNALVDRARN